MLTTRKIIVFDRSIDQDKYHEINDFNSQLDKKHKHEIINATTVGDIEKAIKDANNSSYIIICNRYGLEAIVEEEKQFLNLHVYSCQLHLLHHEITLTGAIKHNIQLHGMPETLLVLLQWDTINTN